MKPVLYSLTFLTSIFSVLAQEDKGFIINRNAIISLVQDSISNNPAHSIGFILLVGVIIYFIINSKK